MTISLTLLPLKFIFFHPLHFRKMNSISNKNAIIFTFLSFAKLFNCKQNSSQKINKSLIFLFYCGFEHPKHCAFLFTECPHCCVIITFSMPSAAKHNQANPCSDFKAAETLIVAKAGSASQISSLPNAIIYHQKKIYMWLHLYHNLKGKTMGA